MANLDGRNKVVLLLEGLALLFDNEANMLINRLISSAVGMIYKLRKGRLRELEAPQLANQ